MGMRKFTSIVVDFNEPDNGVGLIVEDVEEDDEGLKDVEEDGANGQTLQRFPILPELNV